MGFARDATLISLGSSLVVLSSCGSDTPTNDYAQYFTQSAAVCGNGVKDKGETCDGADLASSSCGSLGMGSGTLRCKADCLSFDATACSGYCAQNCSGRQCGPDPVCHLSCGSCDPGICSSAGLCEIPDPDAPGILTLGTNVTTLTQGQSITLTAMVTDPQGLADLIGGSLVDPVNGATYGAFSSTGSAGSYTLTLSWSSINQARSIDFTGNEVRELVAEFLDTAGHRGAKSVNVTLTCPAPTGLGQLAVCDNGSCGTACVSGMTECGGTCCAKTCCEGYCVDTKTDEENCGTCYNYCEYPYGGSSTCTNGHCVASCPTGETSCSGECVNLSNDDANCGACGNPCESTYTGTSACVSGSCALTCNSGYDLCNDACVDYDYDHLNCGSCGHACGDYTESYYACSYGSCSTSPTCKGGYYACGVVCCDWSVHTTGACAWQGSWLGCG